MESTAKTLLIAEQANPDWVSVPLIGWSLATAIARRTPCIIATHVRNRSAIEAQPLPKSAEIVYVDNEHVAAKLHKLANLIRGGAGKGWTTVTALEAIAYYSFESELWRLFRDDVTRGRISLVHRITPLSPTAPGVLAKKCAQAGVPFIVGPLNGGLPWPKGFVGLRAAEREWLSYVRPLYRLLPGYSSLRKFSSLIIAGSTATREQIDRQYHAKTVLIPENGVEATSVARQKLSTPTRPLKCVFVGRLVPYKCPDLLIRAARDAIEGGNISVEIIGDGPMMSELRELASTLVGASKILFTGWLPHKEVLGKIRSADLLVLPSVREFGGGVVLEAMACGVPAIVADYGGPAELVDDQCGIRVPFFDRDSLERNLRGAIDSVVAAPERLVAMSEACLSRVSSEFTWDAKAKKITDLYRVVLSGQYYPRARA